jgi:hypothetical protein
MNGIREPVGYSLFPLEYDPGLAPGIFTGKIA